MPMGDFNYTFTQWPPALDADGLSVHAKEFCDCLYNFLVQHITIPARNDKMLDIVITDEPDMAVLQSCQGGKAQI